MIIINNEILKSLIKEKYSYNYLLKIKKCLINNGTFSFESLSNGLFPATVVDESNSYTGYKYVWIRDNIHISNALLINGDTNAAVNNILSILSYFKKYQNRFEKIINYPENAKNIMNRPHIRFNGDLLTEVDEKWPHAQNDALGYFLWFYCKLIYEGFIVPNVDDIKLITLFPLYFEAINYWIDEDNGHWEEERKLESSSIGAVIAGLLELIKVIRKLNLNEHFIYKELKVNEKYLNRLIELGFNSLKKILPYECIKPIIKQRKYDSALLFLIFPLNVISENDADLILNNVEVYLKGEYGIKRYLGDSFWAPDYKKKLTPEARTIDYSNDMYIRNSLLQEGKEAQWCLFDPLLSIIYGNKYLSNKNEINLKQQIYYFNRSIGQITGGNYPKSFKCPELYYLENNKYVPNDVTPLLWTQANLLIAFKKMEECIESIQ